MQSGKVRFWLEGSQFVAELGTHHSRLCDLAGAPKALRFAVCFKLPDADLVKHVVDEHRKRDRLIATRPSSSQI